MNTAATGTSPSHQRCLRILCFFLYSLPNFVTVAYGQAPTLEFVTPTNGAVYSRGDTIPIVLRAVASNDVFLTADVYVDRQTHHPFLLLPYVSLLLPAGRF